jgi:hypothetical protein
LRCQNVLREAKAAAAAAAAIEPEAEEYLHEDLLDGEGEGFLGHRHARKTGERSVRLPASARTAQAELALAGKADEQSQQAGKNKKERRKSAVLTLTLTLRTKTCRTRD